MSEEVPKWAEKLIIGVDSLTTQVDSLTKQVGINCDKLDGMDKKLDSIVEIVTANGQGIEVISERVDKLEK